MIPHTHVRIFVSAYNDSGDKRSGVGSIISRHERYGIEMETKRVTEQLVCKGFTRLVHSYLAPVGTFFGSRDIP